MARRKTGDKKVTRREVDIPKVQADDHSIAFEELHIGGNVGGDIRIGHTIGYTAEQVSVLLKQITTTFQPKKFDGRCPYKGLEVFEEEDAELFFGRERLVNELVGRVKESRTVFITGPSGSGKSSLVRAGLIHALKQGRIKSSDRWMYETMKPGREPIKDLALAFSRLKSPELEDYFLAHLGETDILNKCAESVLSGKKDQRFVLFVDQFEEVFTQISGEEERLAFINMLAHAGTIENGRVIILFAMRSDFVSNCATYPALNELLSREFRQIGAMQPDELVSAIALPASHVGLPIEDELIARIINDMKGEPGALPLMQFALKDLFDSRQEKGGVIALTLKDYLQHGGIHKSLERHADATFAKLSESEQELTRSIFSGLIEIGRGTQDTKRTALFDELVPANTKAEDVLAVVQKLADARLIITDEQAGKDTVTISHEKLIEAWPWLKKLVNENRDAIALQNEIASDAKEWDDHNRDESYLYSGARLANAREQLGAKRIVLSDLSQIFIDSSQEAEDAGQRQEEQRRQKEVEDARRLAEAETKRAQVERQRAEEQTRSATHLRKRSLYLSIALVAALIAVSAAVFFGFQSRQQTKIAQSNAEEAQKQSQIALARQLAAQAQSINATKNSKQMIAVLLAMRSMQLFPVADAAQVLQNNKSAHTLVVMSHNNTVSSVAFGPDGNYVVSGSWDGTTRVWETTTGQEVTRMTHNDHVTHDDHHDDHVNLVAFSPDGKYVVSGSGDNTARVWEVATGEEVARMTHSRFVISVTFSPDGKYVVSGSGDNTARVWEVASGEEVARMTHDDVVGPVVFSPDGKYVVSGSGDGTARVWEAASGEEIARMIHNGFPISIAFSPDGNYVVSSDDNTVRVWEAASGEEIARMTHSDYIYSVAFSPDGKYVVSGSDDNTARVWEAATGEEVARMTHDDFVSSVVFSPNGRYVISGSADNTARMWEAATGEEVARMTHDGYVNSVAFSPDGKYVVSGSDDNTARVWEVATGEEIALLPHSDYIYSIAFSPDGNYVVSSGDDNTARVWEVATGEEVARMTHDDVVGPVVFSPDGKYVISGSNDNTARVWEAATGEEIARMTHDDWVNSVAFSPDGKYVISGSNDNTARVWEAATGEEVARMTHDHFVRSVVFSPNGNYVVSSGDNTVRVWEVATGEEIARMTHNGFPVSVAFSPDGKYVVSGSGDGTARVWEAASGEEIARMIHNGFPISIAFSPDGNYVVSSDDNTARVWEAATGEEIARMTHDDWVNSVAFSPDGKYVISGSDDNTARVWEAATGEEVARMTHDGFVTSVVFSPNGRYVISGSADGTARVWIWKPDDLIAEACFRVTRNLTRAEWKQYIGNALEYEAICPNLPIEPEPMPTAIP